MSLNYNRYTRREFIRLGGAALGGAAIGGFSVPWQKRVRQPGARVMIFKADSYRTDLFDLLRRGIVEYPEILDRIQRGRVVLKPNIVDHYAGHPVNTNPLLLAAAAAVFRHLGAAEVLVAEGPGHRRDTEMLLALSGMEDVLGQEKLRFVDLNLDAISPLPLASNYTQLGKMFFPHTILNADLVVSMPKLKTHHWSGVTLSMKNMFGIIPGVKYGWPKNLLHWRGIAESIVDINNTIQPGFAIVDGVEGMEGDGPLHGDVINSGVIVMGDNLTAVDATAARIMGVYPENIDYLLYMMASFGGTINEHRIQQSGEKLADVRQDFRVMEHMAFIKRPLPLTKKLLLTGW